MGYLSPTHLLLLGILLVVVFIIWGPGKLPDVGAGLGRAIREFRKASSDTREEFSRAVRTDQSPPPESESSDHPGARDAQTPEPATAPAAGTPAEPAPAAGASVPGPPPDGTR